MTTSVLRLMTASVIILGFNTAHAAAQSMASMHGGRDEPAVPIEIEVPAGNTPYFKGRAVGTQNFICLATSTGMTWRFIGPQATLFRTFGGRVDLQLTTHFLSANPEEDGLPRPTWQHSFDTSQVWGRVNASSSDPAFVEPGAIPWLLLEKAGVAHGNPGAGVLTRTTFIHRINTTGGVAPAANGCSQPADIGVMALVPYEADYVFYKASRER